MYVCMYDNSCVWGGVGNMSVGEYVIYVCMCEHDDVDGASCTGWWS